MKTLISVPKTNGKFHYRVEMRGLCLWHSQSFYSKRQDAIDSAFSDTWSVLIEQIFFIPAALFDLKTGVILSTNYAHRLWLERDCVGCHYSEVLGDLKVNSQILPAGTTFLGLYKVC